MSAPHAREPGRLWRIDVSFMAPVTGDPPEHIDERVWPAVQEEYRRLRATPGVTAAALTAAGLGGLLARRQLERSKPPRLLGVVMPKRLRRRSGRRPRLQRR